ncbi:hypothetical protein RI845_17315 [Thalassotalea nanhaiensis]|uniref:DUF4293 family protein n=1 Tax=Thalassotalea nanhaiensis TaxID=3065648 RepID=A0ABY9THG2_9GAMM|nr:hypothetical protein RI845_17315 [Colwelliaceae bacterium SQ345]
MSTVYQTTKYTLVAFICYIISTVILSGVMMSIWISDQNITGLSPQQIEALANQSIPIQFMSAVIGFVATLIISYVLCKKTLKDGLTTIKAFAVALTFFSMLGIFLHPEHHVIYQVAKLFSPAIICLLGLKLAARHSAGNLLVIEEHSN